MLLRRWIRRFAAPCALLAVAGPAGRLAAACKDVHGQLAETLVPAASCTSLVGLCTVAQLTGNLKGEARFTASAVIASTDTPTTAVVFVIGDTTIVNAQLDNMRGTLIIKDAAAYRTAGEGDLVDNQTIVGGTGDFAGATGAIRVTGTFLAETGGASRFEGKVCVP